MKISDKQKLIYNIIAEAVRKMYRDKKLMLTMREVAQIISEIKISRQFVMNALKKGDKDNQENSEK